MKTSLDEIGESDLELVSVQQIKKPWQCWHGWMVRVVGDGSDKSHYQIIRVSEMPGFEGEFVSMFHGKTIRKVPRNGATIHQYRAQARADKKSRKWRTNQNSWHHQREDY